MCEPIGRFLGEELIGPIELPVVFINPLLFFMILFAPLPLRGVIVAPKELSWSIPTGPEHL